MCPHLSVLITQTLCFHSPLHDTQQPNPWLGIIFSLIQKTFMPTSILPPGPDCCLFALRHLSHSGSVFQWRCGGQCILTGPLDTCLRDGKNRECTSAGNKTPASQWKNKGLSSLSSSFEVLRTKLHIITISQCLCRNGYISSSS